jgi:RHS repeat-associated protein
VKEYDLLDRIIEERSEDQAGNVFRKVQYAYDILGNCTHEKVYSDANTVAETVTLYNTESQPILLIDPLGHQTKILYHYSDHLLKETIDPIGRSTKERYDPLKRLTERQIFSPEGNLLSHTQYQYDGRGHQILQQEEILFTSNGNWNSLGNYRINTKYDSMGEKVQETEQDTKTTTYTYQYGRLHTIQQPSGVILTHTYDPLGRLQELLSSDGTIHYRYTYDLNNNLIQAKDLIHGSQILRSYDALNRVIQDTQSSCVCSFTYDSLDRVKEMTFLDGKVVYDYSPTALLSASRYKNDQLLYTYQQQPNWRGRPYQATLPNGTSIAYSWDKKGQCTQIESPWFGQILHYNSMGNVTKMLIRDTQGNYESGFLYDYLNRLVHEVDTIVCSYSYDSLNNRRTLNGTNSTIDHLNQVTNDGATHYHYDLNGRRIAKGNFSYSYDALGRLTAYSGENFHLTFLYDPLGRCIARSTPTSTTQYMYQLDTEIGAIEGGVLKEFRLIHGKGTLTIELDGEVYSPIRNHRGDIWQLQNRAGDVVANYRYTAFGGFDHTEKVHSPWLFSGQRFDNGLYRFDKRFYDPSVGRWIAPDPLGFADGPNLFAYVNNNPLIYIDPYGLWREHLNDFFRGTTRGFVDDFSWGASELALGEHHSDTWAGKVGYGLGTAASIVVSAACGSLEAHLIEGAAVRTFKGVRAAYTAANAGKVLNETHKVSKIASYQSPTTRLFQQIKNSEKLIAREGVENIAENIAKEGAVKVAKKGRRNRFFPDTNAIGPHSVFRRDPLTGGTSKYETYRPQMNPYNPNPWESVKRFDGPQYYHYHFNQVTKQRVYTPHIHDPHCPGGIREPLSWEIPD